MTSLALGQQHHGANHGITLLRPSSLHSTGGVLHGTPPDSPHSHRTDGSSGSPRVTTAPRIFIRTDHGSGHATQVAHAAGLRVDNSPYLPAAARASSDQTALQSDPNLKSSPPVGASASGTTPPLLPPYAIGLADSGSAATGPAGLLPPPVPPFSMKISESNGSLNSSGAPLPNVPTREKVDKSGALAGSSSPRSQVNFSISRNKRQSEKLPITASGKAGVPTSPASSKRAGPTASSKPWKKRSPFGPPLSVYNVALEQARRADVALFVGCNMRVMHHFFQLRLLNALLCCCLRPDVFSIHLWCFVTPAFRLP